MNLIVNKFTKVILSITSDITYDVVRNPIDNTTGIGYFIDQVNVISDISVPDNIQPNKYCYTSTDGFYLNAGYDTLTADERLTNVEANIDYLMLLNDPDSAAEETE